VVSTWDQLKNKLMRLDVEVSLQYVGALNSSEVLFDWLPPCTAELPLWIEPSSAHITTPENMREIYIDVGTALRMALLL